MAANKRKGVLDKFLEKRSQNMSNPEREMGFIDHIEELRWHLFRSIIALSIGAIFAFLNIEYIFDQIILGPAKPDFISYQYLCKIGKLLNLEMLCMDGAKLQFQNTAVAGQFMISLTSSAMIGFIFAFPYIVWEFWRFTKPALKQSESNAAKGIVFWVTLLFLTGVLFSYFVIVPFTISFFAQYQLSPQFQNIITIANYFDMMSDLIFGVGIVFQLPVLVYFLSKIGLLTPKFLRQNRRYAVIVILVLSAVITPPDWFTIFLVFFPLYGLYEVSIIISGRIHKKYLKEQGLQELDW